jgi:hypothetical protein
MQWAKEKEQTTNNDLQNRKIDWGTRTSLQPGEENVILNDEKTLINNIFDDETRTFAMEI